MLVYLRDNGNRPLVFAPNSTRGLDTFVDSNWGTRFSVSGCLIFYHGCLFHWFSKAQKSVSLSSAEAEYFGGMLTARDLLWLRDLLLDLGIVLGTPPLMQSDALAVGHQHVDGSDRVQEHQAYFACRRVSA